MNVPEGFKQTEVGVIPKDWEVVALGELTEKVGSGITPTGGQRVYKEDGRPFMRSQNVGWGSLLLDDVAFIDDATHATFSSTEIQLNDVFLNITGASIGRSAIADSRVVFGNVNQHVCIIRTDNSKLSSRFLNYFLLSANGQMQIDIFQAGGNRQGLNFSQVRSIRIAKPKNIKEQTAIAAALSDMDALIEGVEKLLAKKCRIKQGAMQELLRPKEGWVKRILGEILKIKHGKSQKDVCSLQGIYPILASGGIIGRAANFLYKKPSVLIGRKGTIDEPQYMDTPFWAVDTLFYSEILNGYNAKFIFYLFKLIDWYAYNEASGVPSLNAKTIENIEKYFPELEEQERIVAILSDMDSEIEQLETQLAKYRQLKTGMMQELLTGKKRLV